MSEVFEGARVALGDVPPPEVEPSRRRDGLSGSEGVVGDVQLCRYFETVGATLEAAALGHPLTQRWAITVSEYRSELLRNVKETPPVVQELLDAMDVGRQGVFADYGEAQMGAESS